MVDKNNDVDILVIGGGVVGCSIARELSRYKLRTALVEKSTELASGASRANTGLVHAGYNPVPGSVKARLNMIGNRLFGQLTSNLNVPFRRNGALVVALDRADRNKLEELKRRGEKNGVERLELWLDTELRERVPALTERACDALYAPSAAIVSPYELTFALAENAHRNGVAFHRGAEVTGIDVAGSFSDGKRRFRITTKVGIFHADIVINAAGLYSDEIEQMAGATENEFEIRPRRGEYLLLDKGTGIELAQTIFQLPTSLGKGVVVTPTTGGNILIGPNAEDIDDKTNLDTSAEGQSEVLNSAVEILPDISEKHVITTFAGLRSINSTGDFVIGQTAVDGFINAAGIASPGLTAAPAIALEIVGHVKKELGVDDLPQNSSFSPMRKRRAPFGSCTSDERAELIGTEPLNSNVVCRCEHVTEAEVRAAVTSEPGARTLDGVKLRTRAGMGRCQGGYCTDRVMKILADEFNVTLEQINKNEYGSWILSSRTKLVRGKIP